MMIFLPTISLEVDFQTLKIPGAKPQNWEVCKSGEQLNTKQINTPPPPQTKKPSI